MCCVLVKRKSALFFKLNIYLQINVFRKSFFLNNLPKIDYIIGVH